MVDRSLPPEFPDAPEVQPLQPPGSPVAGPGAPRRRSAANPAMPWLIATVVVLLLAASAGLGAAWIVASLRAVPVPPAAQITPTPVPATDRPSEQPTLAPSQQPRHTPTPTPLTTPEPSPFIHVVQRGEYLSYIADLYGVELEDIVALNDIRNPNRIHPGQELLIPGYGTRPSPRPR